MIKMKICSKRKTGPFCCKNVTTRSQSVPSWSEVWRASPAREAVCVGAALCLCAEQPSGPRGCVGHARLIHMPSPAGISKMGPLAGAARQLGPPLPTPFPSTGERRTRGKWVKMQGHGMMAGWPLRAAGQKASDFLQYRFRTCDFL